jgi:hypothetical protein
MALDFPNNPSNGDIFQGYVYNATRGVWDIKLLADQNLEDLDNVNVTTPTDGQALIYDATNTEWIAGDVASGPAPAKIIDSNNINIDFSDGIELEKRTVTGDVTFTGSNYTSGVKKTVYLEGDTVQRSLIFPVDWTFLTDKPTAIGASKNNILDLNSFGTSASNTVAIWLGQSAFEPITASGGTVTEILVAGITYKVHTFNTSGTLSISSLGSVDSVEYLIVAGGGGGGGDRVGGGGGAGGLLTGFTPPSTGSFNCIVGNGGSAGIGNNVGGNGQNSSIFSLTAIGGGGGAWGNSDGAQRAATGGSGGGGADGPSNGYNPGASGTSGQGNSGGRGYHQSGVQTNGGGGGGYSSAGTDGSTTSSGAAGYGGNGFLSSISGTSVIYSAGGGGGAWSGLSIGFGGNSGVGGNGAHGTQNATVGTSFGCGGGGGTTGSGSRLSSAGTSGIVIIRYPITDPN